MQLQQSIVETRCGQWIASDISDELKQSLKNHRPMPERFWIVDHSSMNIPGCRAYNPSIIEKDGKVIMSFRRHGLGDLYTGPDHFESCVVICDLDESLSKGSNYRVVSGLTGESAEDARLFHHNGRINMSYTKAKYFADGALECMMECAQLREEEMSALLHHDTRFGLNGSSNEKNWTYFSAGGSLRFVYNIEPLIVFEVDTRKIWYHRHAGEWVFGIPHGGTPPIKVDGLWYSFFHSHRKDEKHGRRYFLGAYAFDDQMKVKMFTPWPIMAADASDGFCFEIKDSKWIPIVTLPCGSIFKDGKWIVSVGINDSYCGIMELSHEKLHSIYLKEVLNS